jgi:cytochrome c556
MKAATLAHMRDHLAALQEIQQALSAARFDEAAAIAEKRLGMSSMPDHGAHEVARYMPAGMREAGTQMHRSASRFAVAATESAVSQDVKPALSALAQVTATCVACHAAYRLE